MANMRKYGVTQTIVFPLITFGGTDFVAGASFVAADTQISKDLGAFANTTNVPTDEGNGTYSLVLTATEMQAANIIVTLIDSATKIWEDQALTIDTYGNASAQHGFDLSIGAIPELAAGIPTATPTLQEAAMLAYMALRNKYTSTATLIEVKDDAGATIAKATVSDNGTTFTREEMVAGP